jgi:hypothetical protein
VYGSHQYSEGPAPGIETIPLNAAALSDIGMAVGQYFVIGGALTSEDDILATTPAQGEYVYGSSDGAGTQRLDLVTAVPEPATPILICMATIAMIQRTRKPFGGGRVRVISAA